MRLSIRPFEGERPSLQPDVLPENAASEAINCRFMSGNLESWLDLAEAEGIVKEGSINSIFLMTGGFWLHWTDDEIGDYAIDVDVARGPLPGDESEYLIFTGTDAPRWTNLPLATTKPPDVDDPPGYPPVGADGEYPYVTYLLGVPAPDSEPVLAVASSNVDGNITVTNPGADASGGSITGWSVDTGDLASMDEVTIPFPAQDGTHYFAGISAVALTEAHQDLTLATIGAAPLQGFELSWYRASGTAGGTTSMGLQFLDEFDAVIEQLFDPPFTATPALTWSQASISAVAPENTIKVRLVQRFSISSGVTNRGFIDAIALTAKGYTTSYDGSSLSGWELSEPVPGDAEVTITAGTGRPAPAIKFDSDDSGSWMFRLAGTQNSPKVTVQFDVYLDQQEFYAEFGVLLFASATGLGSGIALNREANAAIRVLSWTSWENYNSNEIENVLPGSAKELLKAKWLRVMVTADRKNSTTSHLTFSVTRLDAPFTAYTTNHEVDVPIDGDYFGFRFSSHDDANDAFLDNIQITVESPILDAKSASIFTNYVTTWVNLVGQEGPPSPTSRDIQKGVNTVVTLTPDVTPPDGYGINRYRIYRAVTLADGTVEYFLVTEQLLSVETFEDDTGDADITDADILETVDWDLPPDEGQGVIALPNGVTCMFAGKEWAPSVINRPHAYPLQYRHTLESPIVGQGAIDTSAVVWTQTRPYMIIGSDPSRMSEVRFEHDYGLMSKRSIASIHGYGVIGASPVGLVAVTGPRRAEIVTRGGYFEQREWKALNPASIIGVAHDDRYFFSWMVDEDDKGAYIFDPRKDGNGLTQMSTYFKEAFTDPVTDTLYLIDEDDQLLEWEGGDTKMARTFLSRLYVLPIPTNFTHCRVRAKDYTDLTVYLYEDSAQYYTRVVLSEKEFTIKAREVSRFRMRITGGSVVESIQVVTDPEEFK